MVGLAFQLLVLYRLLKDLVLCELLLIGLLDLNLFFFEHLGPPVQFLVLLFEVGGPLVHLVLLVLDFGILVSHFALMNSQLYFRQFE